ncbi:MAG: hypothetical protein AB6733_20170 [Clostridiaceae bacterium]
MNNFSRKLIVLLGGVLILASLAGCSSGGKETTAANVKNSLTEYKNGDRFYKSEVNPITEAEKVIAESLKIEISDEYDKFKDVYADIEVNNGMKEIYEKKFKDGYYTEEITIHSFSKVSYEVYTNKESGIKYYDYLDRLKEFNPYETEVIEVNYTKKLTEKYDKEAQWGSGTYTRYYVLSKAYKYADFKIFDIYGHM